MAAPWNPNDPEAVGVEFLAELTRSWTVGSTRAAATAVSQQWRSTAAEASPDLSLFATAATGTGYLIAEIMDEATEDGILSDIQIDEIAPVTATNVINFQNQAGSTTPANLIASIDETGDPPNTADYIQRVVPGLQNIDLSFDGAAIAAATTGRRVLGVAIGISPTRTT
jgi:hypothetical protein